MNEKKKIVFAKYERQKPDVTNIDHPTCEIKFDTRT